MVATYSLLFVLALLLSFFVVLPATKKRPVFIREIGCTLLVTIAFSMTAVITPLLYLVAVLAGLMLYLSKPWIIYGISREEVDSALERAAMATRTSYEKTGYGYKLNDDIIIKTVDFGGRFHLIRFKEPKGSKKAKLTKNVSRKFIQNYFVST
jgi:hypothetical protein